MSISICGIAITLAKLANSIGLILDIFGAVLLFKFGLPDDIRRKGEGSLLLEGTDEAEIAKGKRYDRLGRLGVTLLIFGFVLQLVSNFL